MESRVSRRIRRALGCGLMMGSLLPSAGAAQSPPAPQVVPADTATSRAWFTAGVSFTAMRGDCQTCEDEGLEFPFRRSASIFGNAGYRVNDRMDVGAEILWVAMDSEDGNIRTTHFNAIAQFRPWASQGFFLKGGAGMAFIRNWVDVLGPSADNSKALSLMIGGGWAFWPRERVGLQFSASQHVAALGDFQRAEAPVQDVIGNFWSLGVAIVIR